MSRLRDTIEQLEHSNKENNTFKRNRQESGDIMKLKFMGYR